MLPHSNPNNQRALFLWPLHDFVVPRQMVTRTSIRNELYLDDVRFYHPLPDGVEPSWMARNRGFGKFSLGLRRAIECFMSNDSTQVVTYGASLLVYNLYFHPLAGYPGPWLGRASLVCHSSADPCVRLDAILMLVFVSAVAFHPYVNRPHPSRC